MTKEEKELLLRDLSARLPYGVKIYTAILPDKPVRLNSGHLNLIGDIKILPYLRSMSSMTEEESKEFALLQTDFYVDGFLYPIAAINMVNWLNKHHFDYRGLIPMGLALEAPEGMYK